MPCSVDVEYSPLAMLAITTINEPCMHVYFLLYSAMWKRCCGSRLRIGLGYAVLSKSEPTFHEERQTLQIIEKNIYHQYYLAMVSIHSLLVSTPPPPPIPALSSIPNHSPFLLSPTHSWFLVQATQEFSYILKKPTIRDYYNAQFPAWTKSGCVDKISNPLLERLK